MTNVDEAVKRLNATLQAADYTGLGNTHAWVPLADLTLILSALKVRTEALQTIADKASDGRRTASLPFIARTARTALTDEASHEQ